MRKFNAIETINYHYVFLAQERKTIDNEEEFSCRFVNIQNTVLRKDFSYFEWLLDELIKYEEYEHTLHEEDYTPSVLNEDQRLAALDQLITSELNYVHDLRNGFISKQKDASLSDNAQDTQKWVKTTSLELKRLLAETNGQINSTIDMKHIKPVAFPEKRRGRPSADWEAIKCELLRWEQLGNLPLVKDNRLTIGKMLWDWYKANNKENEFKNPNSAPKTIKDRPEIKYEFDRIEKSQRVK